VTRFNGFKADAKPEEPDDYKPKQPPINRYGTGKQNNKLAKWG
jgi:hypothetical protein